MKVKNCLEFGNTNKIISGWDLWVMVLQVSLRLVWDEIGRSNSSLQNPLSLCRFRIQFLVLNPNVKAVTPCDLHNYNSKASVKNISVIMSHWDLQCHTISKSAVAVNTFLGWTECARAVINKLLICQTWLYLELANCYRISDGKNLQACRVPLWRALTLVSDGWASLNMTSHLVRKS